MGSHTTPPRIETDSLGSLELPGDVLYGINTLRSINNFPISGRSIATWPDFIFGLATVKQAAALANLEIGLLSPAQASAIAAACEALKAGKHASHLAVDMLEGSGGTSTNMNVNEVIANLCALSSSSSSSSSGGQPGVLSGDYSFVHPNDHVNLGQSTNDVVPTGMKLGIYRSLQPAIDTLYRLADAFARKKGQYTELLRLGRTCLQDAQPMTLGQAMGGYEAVVRRHAKQLEMLREQFLTVPLGGTAIGTGFGASPGYKEAVFRQLSKLMGEGVEVKPSEDPFDGMQNMDTCARLSGELRNTANSLWKVATDLTTLSSGPNGGLGEITLPAVQAGSSIMPGKVNPVMPMLVCQASLAITGNDASVALGCQQGMLEINHFESLVCDRLMDSIRLLTNSAAAFREKCVEGLVANEEVSLRHLLASSALATALVPELGYAKVASIVRTALKDEKNFLDVAVEKGLLGKEDIMGVLRRSVGIQK